MPSCEKKSKFFVDMYFNGKNQFDYDLQFFYYYVLFNFLYNSYDDEVNPRSSEAEHRKKNEEERIKAFVGYVIQSDSVCFSNYNPFAELYTCKQLILIGRVQKKIGTVDTSYSKKSSDREVKVLFSEIYKVRCDIFHGNLNFTEFEQQKVIGECNTVFERFFDFYFQGFVIPQKNTSNKGEEK